jgi:hypothetical protein
MTSLPIAYGTAGQSAATAPVPPAASVSPARPTCQPWWPRRGVGLSFTLPTQAPHDANRRAAKANPSAHSLSSVNTTEVNHDCRQGHPERADKDAHA